MTGDRERLEHLGDGPAATGPGGGWGMSAELLARCVSCDGFVSLAPHGSEVCPCGALHKDDGAARFGSRLGDDRIETYRRRR